MKQQSQEPLKRERKGENADKAAGGDSDRYTDRESDQEPDGGSNRARRWAAFAIDTTLLTGV